MGNALTVAEGQKVSPLKWFEFRQNNSGGSFDHMPSEGIGYAVWVQARNVDDANTRARGIGLYFDGIDDGQDCDCCGDRWSEAWRDSGQVEEPSGFYRYGTWGIGVYAHRYDGTFYRVTTYGEVE